MGTKFVVELGEGQLTVATVRRSRKSQQGLEFEQILVADGNGGLCTRSRVSSYQLVAAGLPENTRVEGPHQMGRREDGKASMPAFGMASDAKAAALWQLRKSRLTLPLPMLPARKNGLRGSMPMYPANRVGATGGH